MTLYFKTFISEDPCASILALNRIRQQLSVDPRKKQKQNKVKKKPKTLVLGGGNTVLARA